MLKRRISESANYFVKINSIFVFITLSLLLLNTPHVTYDGWQYLSSGKSIFDGTYFENYFFVRDPIYPIFIGLCLKIFDSLWVILILQTYLCVVSIGLLIETVVNSTIQEKSKRILHKAFLAIACWITLGSLPSFILQQNAILILFAFVARKAWKIDKRSEVEKLKTKDAWFTWTLVLWIAFLISLEIFLIVLLLIVTLAVKKRITRRSFFLIAIVSSLLALATTSGMSELHTNAQQSESYNKSNLNDPFLNEDFTTNLKRQLMNANPPYTQKAIRAFLANLDLSPTVGWDGIYTDLYKEPGHPMRAFGLNHLLQQIPLCNDFPKQGVIAVREGFVTKYEGCLNPAVHFPSVLKPFIYGLYLIGWPLVVLIAAFGRSKRLLWLPGITLSVYALLGAGISRYGMVVYPIIIIAAYVNLELQVKARKTSDTNRK